METVGKKNAQFAPVVGELQAAVLERKLGEETSLAQSIQDTSHPGDHGQLPKDVTVITRQVEQAQRQEMGYNTAREALVLYQEWRADPYPLGSPEDITDFFDVVHEARRVLPKHLGGQISFAQPNVGVELVHQEYVQLGLVTGRLRPSRETLAAKRKVELPIRTRKQAPQPQDILHAAWKREVGRGARLDIQLVATQSTLTKVKRIAAVLAALLISGVIVDAVLSRLGYIKIFAKS